MHFSDKKTGDRLSTTTVFHQTDNIAHVLTDEVVRFAGVVLRNVRNRLERFKENRESFAMSRVAAVEHHHSLTVVVDVAVQVLGTTHLY